MAIAQSLDQIRAAHAWKSVNDDTAPDYVNVAKGAPSLIMSNGLMQTLAFLKGKGGSSKDLLTHILSWFGTKNAGLGKTGNRLNFTEAMELLHGSSANLYMHATRESLEYLRWIRHFAAAIKKG